jgi:hypothetical protein
MIVDTTSRVWRSRDSGQPAPSNGTFYSDLGFQNRWVSSRNQPVETGITNFLGAKPDNNDAASALDAFRAEVPKMSQKMADSLDPSPGDLVVLERLCVNSGKLRQRRVPAGKFFSYAAKLLKLHPPPYYESPGPDKEANWLPAPKEPQFDHAYLCAEIGGAYRQMEPTAGGNGRPHHRTIGPRPRCLL